MSASVDTLETINAMAGEGYKYGFVTDIESDSAPPGLDEDTVRFISAKKREPEWLLEWRLKAFRHWQKMESPNWAKLRIAPIDYQAATYYSAPKQADDAPKSLDEVDPELLKTYEKLGIPLRERAALAGVAVDAVFDSVSVATTFKDKLGELGIIFCSFGEAVREHPELVRQISRLGRAARATISSPRSIPRCSATAPSSMCRRACAARWSCRPISASTPPRAASSSAPCSSPTRAAMSAISKAAPRRSATRTSLHAAVVELVALEDAQIKYSTVQNWYPGDAEGRGGIYNFVTKRGACRGRPRENLLDPGRNRLGDHLEISELPARRR